MNQLISHPASTLISINRWKEIDEYSTILDSYGLAYFALDDYYWQVGTPSRQDGWILDIAVVLPYLRKLITELIPELVSMQIPFQLVRNSEVAQAVLDGELGYRQLGKLICLYPENGERAAAIAKNLISLTDRYQGPMICTDRHLGTVLHARYHFDQVPDAIPFLLPVGVTWPFTEICAEGDLNISKVLQGKYLPMSVLKNDAKGNVTKALWLRNFYMLKWCVIKEGKRHMISDAFGRDICDRLQWQFQVHKALSGSVPIPKVYEIFKANGNSFLVMEHIKGPNLDDVIVDIFKGRCWAQINLFERQQLIGYGIQLVNIVATMHAKGYLHRDITPGNFLVSREKLWMIDLELAYDQYRQRPSPAYLLGTIGFMSPEQDGRQQPTSAQDIYAIGACLLVVFTGLVPAKFATVADILQEQLKFFIPSSTVIEAIIRCLDSKPENRPSLADLKNCLHTFSREQTFRLTVAPQAPRVYLDSIIQRAINGLADPIMVTGEGLWFSRGILNNEFENYNLKSITIHPGYYDGLSGIRYLLACAKQARYSVAACENSFQLSNAFIDRYLEEQLPQFPSGLYQGTTGILIAQTAALAAGMIADNDSSREEWLALALHNNAEGNGVVKGAAGQGIALLYALTLFDDENIIRRLNRIVDLLLQAQQPDGAWLSHTDTHKHVLKLTGFGHGAAGILCFLLGYLRQSGDSRVEPAIVRGILWLRRQSHERNGKLIWYRDNKGKVPDLSLQDGVFGIALCFIKAYEILGTTSYRTIAESVLSTMPRRPVARDLSLSSGLVGLGELYIEAMKVFSKSDWQDGVDWIAALITHHFRSGEDNICYWQVDQSPFISASLMNGNAGILHFLLRCKEGSTMKHPLLLY